MDSGVFGHHENGWYENLTNAVNAGRPDLVSHNYSSSHFFQALAAAFDGSGGATIGIPNSGLQVTQGNIQQVTAGNFRTNSVIGNHLFTRACQDGNQNIGFHAPTLTDPSVFDYRNHLMTGSLAQVNTRFDTQSVTLEPSFFKDRFGFEGSLDRQFYHLDYYQPFGSLNPRNTPVYIDTSAYLFNGMPNPNVGLAVMVQAPDSDQWRNTHRDHKRVTAFLDLDTKQVNRTLGQWLGRHMFTGLWQKESVTLQGLNYGMYLVGNDFNIPQLVSGQTTASATSNLRANALAEIAYVSDDLRGKEANQVRLYPIAAPRVPEGATFGAAYFDRSNSATGGAFKTGSVRAVHVADGAVATFSF